MGSTDENNEGKLQQSIYGKLYHLAENALVNEAVGHSMQATLLTNDAYLRLLEQKNVNTNNKAEVMAAGATIIRRLLIDYARRRKAQKRGGEQGRGQSLQTNTARRDTHPDLLELNDALEVLAKKNPRAARVVELKYFGGMNGKDIAKHLDVSCKTINNDWKYAKEWLKIVLGPDQDKKGE